MPGFGVVKNGKKIYEFLGLVQTCVIYLVYWTHLRAQGEEMLVNTYLCK